MAPTLGGGTQDTDFNKGFTKGFFTTNLRRRNGVSGGPRPPYKIIPFTRPETPTVEHNPMNQQQTCRRYNQHTTLLMF